MKIAKIDVFNFDRRKRWSSSQYVHGTYIRAMSLRQGRRWTGDRARGEIRYLPSISLVRVTSDTGLTGWGEVCPLGTTCTWLRMRAALEPRLNSWHAGGAHRLSPHWARSNKPRRDQRRDGRDPDGLRLCEKSD